MSGGVCIKAYEALRQFSHIIVYDSKLVYFINLKSKDYWLSPYNFSSVHVENVTKKELKKNINQAKSTTRLISNLRSLKTNLLNNY